MKKSLKKELRQINRQVDLKDLQISALRNDWSVEVSKRLEVEQKLIKQTKSIEDLLITQELSFKKHLFKVELSFALCLILIFFTIWWLR